MLSQDAITIEIVYTNYRGETSTRRVVPRAIRFGSNEWHPEPQWLLDGIDCDKGQERSFAMKDIHEWRPAQAPTSKTPERSPEPPKIS